MTIETHIQALRLRRFSAGELGAGDASDVERHAASCPVCRARLKELADEQRRFEQEISFDRFAAGVERAARTPRALPEDRARAARRWLYPALGMAAAVALAFTFAPRTRDGDRGLNHLKGGAAITVQVAAPTGVQRTAASQALEALSPGERLRIGYQPGAHRFVTSVTIDDHGEVTPLYPEAGRSLPVSAQGAPGAEGATRYLPDSVELTGKGLERLIVILGDEPLEVEAVRRAASSSYRKAGGDLAHLPPLAVPGEQFQRTFLKP